MQMQVLLLSEGIRAARDIGRKTVSLFSLSKQLLSPQQHYDWGLRALKTVLGISGRLLQVRAALLFVEPASLQLSLSI